MKKNLLSISIIVFCITTITGQDCSELFFSEYAEGSYQNKAIEVYNPTNSTIDLSGYRIERFSNGQ